CMSYHDSATTVFDTLSLHDALPIFFGGRRVTQCPSPPPAHRPAEVSSKRQTQSSAILPSHRPPSATHRTLSALAAVSLAYAPGSSARCLPDYPGVWP